jgi:hypothetical protein
VLFGYPRSVRLFTRPRVECKLDFGTPKLPCDNFKVEFGGSNLWPEGFKLKFGASALKFADFKLEFEGSKLRPGSLIPTFGSVIPKNGAFDSSGRKDKPAFVERKTGLPSRAEC